jgi:ribonuclease P protein component
MKSFTLRKNKEFQYIYRKGKSMPLGSVVLIHVPSAKLKIGFCVSKRVGNSVKRNRAKRLLKEAFRSIMPNVKPARLVFVARVSILKNSYWEIRAHMIRALKKANLYEEAAEK